MPASPPGSIQPPRLTLVEGGGGIWAALAERTDPVAFRPELAPDIEVKQFAPRYGEAHVFVANPRDLVYYRLTPAEAALLPVMDGTRTVGELVVEHLRTEGELDLASVTELVNLLYRGNFLTQRFTDSDAALKRALDRRPRWRRSLAGFARTLSIEWPNAERLVRTLYRGGGRLFFTRPGRVISALVSVAGLAAFVAVVRSGDYGLTNRHFGLTFAILLALDLAIVFIHELGHAAVLVHYGRRVKSAGFRIYFGSPAFFIESSDVLMLDRRPRMVQSFAGPYAELIIAGAVSIAVWAMPGAVFTPLAYQFLIINYYVLFLNLVPMLELDGYWLLSDGLQMPDLRPRSLAFVRRGFWRKLARRQRFTRGDIGLGLYGTVGVLFTVACLASAVFFWQRVFGDTVSQLWNGGILGVTLLALLVLFLGGPVLRGLADAVRAIGRRLRARLRSARFRFQRGWRVEAAQLLDASGVFGDIPAEVLSEVAGRVALRSYRLGQAIVHQGERADSYYLIRSGTVEVVEEDVGAGTEKTLRRLGRGEGFGEMGLALGAVRNATVRAAESSVECFVFDKGTFDRLLADRLTLPELSPTLQAMADLRALRPFAHLGPQELANLADQGRWVQVPAGQALLTQGDAGDAFYAVGSGQLEVLQDGARVREVGPGDHVGEVALLTDAPRNATVRALTPTRVFRLERDGFEALVAGAFRRGELAPNVSVERTWNH